MPQNNLGMASGGIEMPRATIAFKRKAPLVDENKPKTKLGTLYKSSPSWFKGWQERYIVLQDGKLKYYKN